MKTDLVMDFLEKYRRISEVLGLEKDEKQFREIIEYIGNINSNKLVNRNRRIKYGEKEFQEIVNSNNFEVDNYDINNDIINHKGNIVEYWNSLNSNEKEQFTIFELNLMLFLVSEQYNKFIKRDKKRIISFLSNAVKSKRMEKSYNSLDV